MVLTILLLAMLTGNPKPNEPEKVRVVQSIRRTTPIKIDGKVTPEEWHSGTLLHKFTELRPTPGKQEEEAHKTVAYLLYDNEGIYFGGTNYEPGREHISSELIGRDGFGNNDFIGIIFDTYKDNLNGFEYFVTPLNEQMDARQAPNSNGDSEDFSWNAVWESATHIHDEGWSFEIFIPLASIRFSPKDVQDWGLNVVRRRQRTGQQLFWNPIDPTVNGFLTQEGYLTGLEKIRPPVRLQFSPYLSFYGNHYPHNVAGVNNYTSQINGGMDLKWGINQAFTLDATLIPDFGQVQSDARVFNLSPFEVRFNENRAFFTEGTELFNRGNLFYSRRIGGTPVNYGSAFGAVDSNETLISNPSETKLLNASKISGRTENGLGIGVLNAVTQPTYALIENNDTKVVRELQTNPLTNYNVLVFNQSLKNNSSISFVNTSVLRAGDAYNSNVAAAMVDLNDKSNTWNAGGQFNLSARYNDVNGNNATGYSHSIYAGKTSGIYRFNVWQDLADAKYSSNDLGYFTNSNYMIQGIWFGISRPKPKGWRNNMNINFNTHYSRLFTPFGEQNPMYQSSGINMNMNAQTKKLAWLGLNANLNAVANDFYEPRLPDRYFRRGASMMVGGWYESNSNKPWSFSQELFVRKFIDFYDALAVDISTSQSWRASEKFSLRLGVFTALRFNNIGFAGFEAGNTVFGKREVRTVETSLRAKYSFTNRMGLTLVGRHYVSSVRNQQLFDLNTNGRLAENGLDPATMDRTANFFNIDLVYNWQIAQGSFVSVVWKSAVHSDASAHEFNYAENFRRTLRENQQNNVSVRMIYFLDYNTLQKSRRRA